MPASWRRLIYGGEIPEKLAKAARSGVEAALFTYWIVVGEVQAWLLPSEASWYPQRMDPKALADIRKDHW